jgi:peroxiredoxin
VSWPYPAPEDDGGTRHLMTGLALPGVTLDTTDGAQNDLWRLRGTTVIFVYPWTGRPGSPNPPDWDSIPGAHGSTPEAEGFRDLHAKFTAQGTTVYGLSVQDSDYQRELARRLRLPYSLLSDHSLEFADALSLPRFSTGGITYLKRLTIVAHACRIAKVFYPVHPPDLHAAEVLVWLRQNPRTASRRE